MMVDSLAVSIAPHIRAKTSTRRIMWAVATSLAPAGAAGVFIFGARAVYVIVVSIISALLTEFVILAMRKREADLTDGSAFLTGLLLAYNLPPGMPLWMVSVGACFAIAIGKQVFGGLGHNIFNPALIGRAFLMVSWPVYMTTWQNPRWFPDAVSTATPLAVFKEGRAAALVTNYADLFLGNRGGCIGEVCVAALLLGTGYLFLTKIITWHVPAAYIVTVAFLSWAFNGGQGLFSGDVLFFLLSGGLVLGAFFMATDYVTSPLSARGKLVFGFGCGLLTFIIRKFAGYPEGVSYSILMMNAVVPLIDRYTFPKWFGAVKNEAAV